MPRRRTVFLLALANLFWAGNFVFSAILSEQVDPVSLTFWRWSLAALPLLAIAWLIERPDWRAAAREWRWHLVQSVFGLTGYALLLYAGIGQTGSVTASVISAINPATIALAAAVFLGDRMSRTQVVGIVLAFVGVAVVLTGGNPVAAFAQGFGVGDLLVLGAVVAWTVYSIIARRLTTPPITATALQAVFATLTMLPVIAFTGLTMPADVGGTLAIAYIVLLPTVAGYALWNAGSVSLGPARAGVFLNLLPVFTVIIALLLGRPIDPAAIVGGAVVLVGVYLTVRVRRTTAVPVEPVIDTGLLDLPRGDAPVR
ncbi:drug/metabolite transporter (DMT)-like permease [Agromyces terreus]|uniref:Drug/metabolite transporter (DMT)-like permease n=1 Tax=Agromyces terreus TaxID=424795 RepID=A0A9X2H451_9MICO|nr:DMT family transporter [Agromyces terreus]MCP2372440.1 drug/metabolite transporter (DMT)-like permease [Agromyces terreus]